MAAALTLLAAPLCARAPGSGLTRAEAELRASVVASTVGYRLWLSLDASSPAFAGRAELRFALAAPAERLTVDLDSAAVSRLRVNGAEVSTPDYNGAFMTLPKDALRAGENVVAVDYTRPYSATGAGLYRFKDPEDGRVYLYTQFEPYDANKLFPCFDQPDLKGTYTLGVEAPSEWEVVSTSTGTADPEKGGRRTWSFEPTPPLASYVFSLHAGPWAVWSSTAGAVPLRLFARRSLSRYVDAEEWFDTTRRGLAFYGDYFGIPYPFGKYDQLIVPDSNAGAMENVAAVTFSERNVRRSSSTVNEREDLASDILHEMAHMWFGDLVTMSWWDGLWLNESFATYMSALAQARATRFERAWLTLFAWGKRWAYYEDQLDTTHPIEGEVPDTDHAFSNFDGITYGKGASALKQLAFLLGGDAFRDGIRAYLAAHAYGNAREGDFFGAMGRAADMDLDGWTRQWLETAGVDAVSGDLVCSGGTVASLTVRREPPSGRPASRRHRTRVGLYSLDRDGTPVLTAATDVSFDAPRAPMPDLAGKPCPALVLANLDDEDYAKAVLDARSLAAAKGGVSRFRDPLMRLMLWHTLWEMVQDARWPATELSALALRDLGQETDPRVLASALEMVHGTSGVSRSLLGWLPKPDYPAWEGFLWGNAARAEPGSDLQRLWYDAFARVAASPTGQAWMRGLLDGKGLLPGAPLDQDRRWELVVRLNELGAEDAEELAAAEAARDPSDRGRKAALTAQAARPGAASKGAWLARITEPGTTLSLDELRAAMEDFYPLSQVRRRPELLTRTLAGLAALSAAKDADFLDDFGKFMLPTLCSPSGAAAYEAYLASSPALKPILLKDLRNTLQEERRCVKARALLGSGAH